MSCMVAVREFLGVIMSSSASLHALCCLPSVK